jgi:23S rRNA pseudouridine2604 synthase
MEKTRINKYLSEVGYCSRRAADKLLEEGRIKLTEKFLNWEQSFR